MLNMLSNLLITVGAYALTVFLYENLRSPWLLLRAAWQEKCKGIKPLSLKERYGEWAAITGASDGIGKEYAKALARKGLNIVLISRSEAKLKSLAEEIENESGVQTKILVVDFTHDDSIYEYMSKELDKLPIGILINNVGANTPRIDYFATFTHKEIANVLHTNIIAVTQLSRYFLQRMKNQKLKGCIINISSLLEMWQVKRGALYAASKAFTRSLTLSLQLEAKPLGITVQLVSPSFVSTKINAYSKFVMRGAWYIPTAEAYAKWAVETIGVTDITTGYHAHGLKAAIAKVLPWQLRAKIIDFLGRHLVDSK